MDKNFWLRKWEQNETAFHRNEGNPHLVKHFQKLALSPQDRVFLPLCGKTGDIPWLLSQNVSVAGAELSEIAVKQLFADLKVVPKISDLGKMRRYSAENIDIFVGDFFELSKDALGPVSAVYDRAALVALPEEMRREYTAHLMRITNRAPQLLICYEYDQSIEDGPPFSVSSAEVSKHYENEYRVTCLERLEVEGGLRGKVPSTEAVYLLRG